MVIIGEFISFDEAAKLLKKACDLYPMEHFHISKSEKWETYRVWAPEDLAIEVK